MALAVVVVFVDAHDISLRGQAPCHHLDLFLCHRADVRAVCDVARTDALPLQHLVKEQVELPLVHDALSGLFLAYRLPRAFLGRQLVLLDKCVRLLHFLVEVVGDVQ